MLATDKRWSDACRELLQSAAQPASFSLKRDKFVLIPKKRRPLQSLLAPLLSFSLNCGQSVFTHSITKLFSKLLATRLAQGFKSRWERPENRGNWSYRSQLVAVPAGSERFKFKSFKFKFKIWKII
jgi:hypothetical protein